MQFKIVFLLALMALCAAHYAAAEVCYVTEIYEREDDPPSCVLDLDCPESGRITKEVEGNDFTVGEEVII